MFIQSVKGNGDQAVFLNDGKKCLLYDNYYGVCLMYEKNFNPNREILISHAMEGTQAKQVLVKVFKKCLNKEGILPKSERFVRMNFVWDITPEIEELER